VERSDVCAVPAAAIVGEAVAAFEIAGALIEKLGGDSVDEMKRNYELYRKYLKDRMGIEEPITDTGTRGPGDTGKAAPR
jgi:chorismate synthase